MIVQFDQLLSVFVALVQNEPFLMGVGLATFFFCLRRRRRARKD